MEKGGAVMATDVLWDDELEDLTTRAIAVHGEEAIFAVTDRTIHELVVKQGGATRASDIKTALKTELRRLLKPH
jgi:hypothetical protein